MRSQEKSAQFDHQYGEKEDKSSKIHRHNNKIAKIMALALPVLVSTWGLNFTYLTKEPYAGALHRNA